MAKILIADDSSMMRKVAKMSLEKGGHSIIEAGDGAEAVELAKLHLPNIILLDAEMPVMDGWEACKVLKSDLTTANIPVLMCTGNDLSQEPQQLKAAGADGYVLKPYNTTTLLEKVAVALHG